VSESLHRCDTESSTYTHKGTAGLCFSIKTYELASSISIGTLVKVGGTKPYRLIAHE
jgi:hypothetical protein